MHGVSLRDFTSTTGNSAFAEPKSPDAATINARWLREGWATWEAFNLIAVDDKFVSHSLFGDPPTTTKVEPGRRKLLVKAHFNRGYGTGPFEAYVPFEVELQPASTYQINGKVNGALVEAWLEEISSQARVGEPGSATYQKEARSTMVPVYIPAN